MSPRLTDEGSLAGGPIGILSRQRGNSHSLRAARFGEAGSVLGASARKARPPRTGGFPASAGRLRAALGCCANVARENGVSGQITLEGRELTESPEES